MFKLNKNPLFLLLNFLSIISYSVGQEQGCTKESCDTDKINQLCTYSIDFERFQCECEPGYVFETGTQECEPYFERICSAASENNDCGSDKVLVCDTSDNQCRCPPDTVYDPIAIKCWPLLEELFGPCSFSQSEDHCFNKFPNSGCLGETANNALGKCDCPTGYFPSLDYKSCLNDVSTLDDLCNYNAQCTTIIDNSFCYNNDTLSHPQNFGECKCQTEFVQEGPTSCVRPVTGETTEATSQLPSTTDASTTEASTTPAITTEESTIDPTTKPSSITTLNQASSSSSSEASSSSSEASSSSSETSSSNSSSPPTTTSPPNINDQFCRQTDQYGNMWEGTFGQTVTQTCPGGGEGTTSWKCGFDGKFTTKTPDYSRCSTAWISKVDQDLKKAIASGNGALDLDQGSEFLSTFDTFITQATTSTGEEVAPSEYFGHEVTNILQNVQLILTSTKFEPTTDLTKLETFTEGALGVSGKVLKFQKPWEQLSTKIRSETLHNATSLLESTALQFVKSVAPVEEMKEIKYLKSNMAGGGSETFVAAGVALNNGGGGTLSFPPDKKHEEGINSFIKLPTNWGKYLKKDDNSVGTYQEESLTSFVGMEMDSSLVKSNIPSITYEDGQQQQPEEEVSPRDLNSKMMSFTLNNPEESVSFGSDEVEVTLLLDQEAWTDTPRKIRRKLGPNEKPKAAGGTPQCVFYNATLKLWSSNGCRLVKSGPYSITCACTHLSSFAILSQFHQYVGKTLTLEVSTAILYGISALAMFQQIYSDPPGIDDLHQNQNKIASFFILIGNILLILFVDKYYFNLNGGICYLVGLLSHFIFLISFSFLLTCTLDVILVLKLRKRRLCNMDDISDPSQATVLPIRDKLFNFLILHKKLIYFFFILGFPSLVVGITAASAALAGGNVRAYGGEFCWLDGVYIWSFYTPVILISASNGILLCYWKWLVSTWDQPLPPLQILPETPLKNNPDQKSLFSKISNFFSRNKIPEMSTNEPNKSIDQTTSAPIQKSFLNKISDCFSCNKIPEISTNEPNKSIDQTTSAPIQKSFLNKISDCFSCNKTLENANEENEEENIDGSSEIPNAIVEEALKSVKSSKNPQHPKAPSFLSKITGCFGQSKTSESPNVISALENPNTIEDNDDVENQRNNNNDENNDTVEKTDRDSHTENTEDSPTTDNLSGQDLENNDIPKTGTGSDVIHEELNGTETVSKVRNSQNAPEIHESLQNKVQTEATTAATLNSNKVTNNKPMSFSSAEPLKTLPVPLANNMVNPNNPDCSPVAGQNVPRLSAEDPVVLQSSELMAQNIKFSLLLSITWFVGFYEIGPGFAESSFLGFLFPILNGLQGMMMLQFTRPPGQGILGSFGFLTSLCGQQQGQGGAPSMGAQGGVGGMTFGLGSMLGQHVIPGLEQSNQGQFGGFVPGQFGNMGQMVPNQFGNMGQMVPNQFGNMGQMVPNQFGNMGQMVPNQFGNMGQMVPNQFGNMGQMVPHQFGNMGPMIPDQLGGLSQTSPSSMMMGTLGQTSSNPLASRTSSMVPGQFNSTLQGQFSPMNQMIPEQLGINPEVTSAAEGSSAIPISNQLEPEVNVIDGTTAETMA